MFVFVVNKHGEKLMPCGQRKARILLKSKKAKVISYKPFAIQLLYGSSGYKQQVNVGIDVGAKHIGVAVSSQNNVLMKGEIELRQDVSSLLQARNMYRRSRRKRKKRYRESRFLNRKRKEGWLPPSIQSRISNTFMWIDKFCAFLPNPTLHIEVGKFDIHKMVNSDIKGIEYQYGQTYGYYATRYFVFSRDNYTCQVCKQQGKILNTHHIVYRSHGGTDRADNLITVCTDCHTHENHQKGNILWKWMIEGKKLPVYKEAAFMNVMRRRILARYPNANITYGNITTPKRKKLALSKTHYNDAIVISGIDKIKRNVSSVFQIKQFRKKKRSLHEGTARKGRIEKNTSSKRNSKNTSFQKGFYLNDKVRIFGKVGYISGFNGKSMAFVKDMNDQYVSNSNKAYKQVNLSDCTFVCHNNNWQFTQHVRFA